MAFRRLYKEVKELRYYAEMLWQNTATLKIVWIVWLVFWIPLSYHAPKKKVRYCSILLTGAVFGRHRFGFGWRGSSTDRHFFRALQYQLHRLPRPWYCLSGQSHIRHAMSRSQIFRLDRWKTPGEEGALDTSGALVPYHASNGYRSAHTCVYLEGLSRGEWLLTTRSTFWAYATLEENANAVGVFYVLCRNANVP